jgi:predicted TIM-barrel fold metal-dependent hydrolase
LPLVDLSAAAAEFERALALPGVVGAQVPGNGFLTKKAAENMRPLVEAANRHNLGGNIPYEIERMDHRSLLDSATEELPSSRFRRAKVFVDCNSFGPGAIESAVRLYGAERIVCGTDGTEFGCEWTSKALVEANIGKDARAKILHRNAAAMMSRLAKVAQRETVAA